MAEASPPSPASASPSSKSPLYDTFARAPIAFARGDGVWLETTDGRRMLDFCAGIAVSSLGHGHPALMKALTEQAGKIWHTSNLFQVPEQVAFAAKLCAVSFADKVFFCNSGAEAVECAIKTARRYQFVSGHPERFRIISFSGAFHGRTIATLAATGNPKYAEGFGPMPEGFDHVPMGDLAALKQAIGPETAAIIVEPLQAEGGVRLVPSQFLRELRALCDQHGLMLIFDEVQSGMGRTGKLFAHQWSGVTPDIMPVAKGIGGGFPLGACLATAEAAKGMTPGTHGSTFGGNPLAMAVGKAALDVISEEPFLEHVRQIGLYLKQRLASVADSHPDLVAEVRGEGLLVGLRCLVPVGDVVAAARDAGLITASAGENVLRLLPPLVVTNGEVDEAIARLETALAAVAERTPKAKAG
ncbi:MAG TPA: aspartate aminotransferase family protein [Bauldia sp.]|nr:aspartate aminotransferase family protein [Bauldia sp.]